MSNENALKVAQIVRDAGGQIVGRTRLQKVAYLLSVTGLEDGLPFVYKHFGPYSEELAAAARYAGLVGMLHETEKQAQWGGMFSIYEFEGEPSLDASAARNRLAKQAAGADAVELELAATAIFLAKEGHSEPWAETARRKPEKADTGRIEKAKALYRQLCTVDTPVALPTIA